MAFRAVDDAVGFDGENLAEPGVEADEGGSGFLQEFGLVTVGCVRITTERASGERESPTAGDGKIGRLAVTAWTFEVGAHRSVGRGATGAALKGWIEGGEIVALPGVLNIAETPSNTIDIDDQRGSKRGGGIAIALVERFANHRGVPQP